MKKKFRRIYKAQAGAGIDPNTIATLLNAVGTLTQNKQNVNQQGVQNINQQGVQSIGGEQISMGNGANDANALNLKDIASAKNGISLAAGIVNGFTNEYTKVDKSPAIAGYKDALSLLSQAQKGQLVNPALQSLLSKPYLNSSEVLTNIATRLSLGQGYPIKFNNTKNLDEGKNTGENINENKKLPYHDWNLYANEFRLGDDEYRYPNEPYMGEEVYNYKNGNYYFGEPALSDDIYSNATDENKEKNNLVEAKTSYDNKNNSLNIHKTNEHTGSRIYEEGTDENEATDDEKSTNKNPLDAEGLQKLGMFGEGLLNTKLAITNAIQANKAWKEYSKIKTPRFEIPTTVRGATKEDTTEAKKNIAGNIDFNRKMMQGNTGNLQALMAGLTNLNKQLSGAYTNLENQANERYKQDEMRMYDKLGENAYQQAAIDYKYKLGEATRKRDMYDTAMKLANAAHQAANQNLINISKNLTDLSIEKKKEFDKINLMKNALLTQEIDDFKRSNPQYYYKIDTNGNIMRDKNGNYIRTTPEEKRKMEEMIVNQFEKSVTAKKLEELTKQLKDSGRIFRRNKTLQRGAKIDKAEKLNTLETIINNFVNLTHKNTLLKLQKNRQLYDASKNAVDHLRKIQLKS